MRPIILVIFICNFLSQLSAQSPSLIVDKRSSGGINFNDIHSDRDGIFWVVKPNLIRKSNGSNNIKISDKNISSKSYLRLKETKNGIKYVIDSRSQIFFIEADTLRAYAYNDKLKQLNIKGYLNDFYFDRNERMHISFSGTGYIIVDNGKISRPLKEKGIDLYGYGCILLDGHSPFMIKNDVVTQSKKDPFSFILFDSTMNLIDKKEIKLQSSIFTPSVTSLRNGDFLYSSGGGHLLRFNKQKIIKEIPYQSNILGLFVDSRYGLWVSTTTDEIHYYEKGKVESSRKILIQGYSSPRVLSEDSEGSVYFRADDGLHLIKNPREQYLTKDQGYFNLDIITKLFFIDNKLIVTGKEGKLSTFDFQTNKADSIVIPFLRNNKKTVYDLYYSEKNKLLWVSLRGSLGYLKDQEYFPLKTVYQENKFRINGKINYLGTDIYRTKNDIDFVAFHKNSFFFVKDSSVTYLSKPYPTNRITNVLIVGDSTWVSTMDGLFLQYDNKIISLGEKYPALNSTILYCTYFDNKIWISAREHGLFTLSNNNLDTIITPSNTTFIDLLRVDENEMWATCKQFNAHITLNEKKETNITFYRGSARNANRQTLDKNSSIIYGINSSNRIQSLQTKNLKKDTIKPPNLIIETLSINSIKVPISNNTYLLKHDEGFIQIDYVGVSFNNVPILYRFRMQGISDKWSMTEQRSIQFTTLPPGTYQFQIQSKREGEPWSKSKYLNFEITPPIWKTWWFITAFILLSLFIGYQIIAYRFRITQREQKLIIERLTAEQKALRAQMDPHFVFNVVTSVQYLIMSKSYEKAIKFLNMFTKSMRGILDQSQNNSINIASEIAFLIEFIEMEQFRLEDRFDYTINTENINEHLGKKIPTFIIQPFIENAIHHGFKNKEEKGHLELDFSFEDNFLKLTITDDGVGREAAKKYKLDHRKLNQKSYGMEIIKARLLLHNSKNKNIWITDLIDKNGLAAGTEISLQIKIIRE